ncbi:hypothetical protein H5T52_04925 [Candidatus Bipolaricaulota bacterium]|nr:hypothetical protein [Candidatus Bipolaricaulota bacterium]
MLRICAVLIILGGVATQLLGGPHLVLYSQGLGLVEETREFALEGEGTLTIDYLPHQVLLDSLTLEGVTVLSLTPKLPVRITPDGVVGEIVQVETQSGTVKGRLISASGDVLVLATEEGLVTVNGYRTIIAPSPGRRAVEVAYRAEEPGTRGLVVRYLTRGLSWQARYRALLEGETLSLVGLAELVNDTGISYPDAQVDLIAGQVYAPAGAGVLSEVRALAASPQAGASPAYEYHRYRLAQPVDLPPGSTFVPYLVTSLPCQRLYRFRGGPVETVLKFVNSAAPLPAGEVTVYGEGGSLLIGAASIDHVPVGEEVTLTIGAAFDLTGSRAQTFHVRLSEELNRDGYRIVIRSAKEEPVVVEVVESLPGAWQITQSSLPFEQIDAHTVKFLLEVPAGGQAELTYTVEWGY